MGVPTVATMMPELIRAGENVSLAENAKEFLEYIENAAKRSKSKHMQEKLKDYALNNCWERRANHLWEKINEYPKASVVILNYGDPNWSLGAIHSLTKAGGNYPNLEIIVVDNGSNKENLSVLAERINSIKKFTNIKLIENKENYGFAKGNNIGIKQCTGDFVVLLNNDTCVSPGAIYSLTSHLRANPEIGVVGPLTNNIGNEAKIFVNYPNIETMRIEAKRWLTGYRGMLTELRTVAYFCVAFRRNELDKFGLLNEVYGTGMFEDDDHCNVIKEKGYKVALAEDAFVHHHLSATFNTIDRDKKKALFEKNKRVYEKKWGNWIPHVYRDERPERTY